MNSFEDRIGLDVPLEVLSKNICENYKLGEFVKNRLIKIGYEDYNYVLTTTQGKFVVKVFSNIRTEQDCRDLADRTTIPNEKGFSSPKIYKANGSNLFVTKLKNQTYRLLVMDHIDGKDFFSLDILPNIDELKLIAVELAKLNQIQYKPNFIYDRWSIINFENEYQKNKSILSDDENKKIYGVVKQLSNCDFSKLKYGFVHGDVIVTNIMKDKKGKLYFIDFSVSNYLPRIVDLAVSIGDLCLDLENIEESKSRTKAFLNSYESINKLDKYEKKCLPVFLKAHQATSILNCLREKEIEKNDSEENQEFLDKSRIALDIVSKFDLIGGSNEISK